MPMPLIKAIFLWSITLVSICLLHSCGSGGGNSNAGNETVPEIPAIEDDWTFLGVPTISGNEYFDVGQILVDIEDEQIMYVTGYEEGLFISRDGGGSWELAVSRKPTYGYVTQDPENPNHLFYGQYDQLNVSHDRGLTWDLNLEYKFEPIIVEIIFSTFYPGTIYITTRGSNVLFYRSKDDGLSWQSYSYGQTVGMENFIPWAVAEDPADGTLYVGVELGNHPEPYNPPFLRSKDGGETWENLVEGMTSRDQGPTWHVTSIVINPDNGKVYALSEGYGFYTSTNQGVKWSPTRERALTGGLVRDMYGRLFAGGHCYGSREGGVYVSTDDGVSFDPFGLQGHTTASFSLSGDGAYLYVAVYQSGIYYTPLP